MFPSNCIREIKKTGILYVIFCGTYTPVVMGLSPFKLSHFLYAAVRMPITLKLVNEMQIPAANFWKMSYFSLSR